MQSELSERLLDFTVKIIKLIPRLNKTAVGRQISGQLIRSSTSAGANYEEACGAESRADFVHKLQVVLKELRESLYWLRLISKSGLIPDQIINMHIREENELANIIGKSIVTAKKNK